MSESIRIRNACVDGELVDCLVVGGLIAGVGTAAGGADVEIDAAGGALLPGLADHHLHLFAMAAAASSVDLSDASSYNEVVVAARDRDMVRVVGWDDERLGDLDRDRLDAMAGGVPVRVQHRSGALWVLNSAALSELDESAAPAGAERDESGRLTGRLWRGDAWLRTAETGAPDLTEIGKRLASYGVTSVTDATPDLDDGALAVLVAALESGALPQRLHLLGAADGFRHPRITVGPRKVVVADHALPSPDELASTISSTHHRGRAVAVHCISRAGLATTVAALRTAGSFPGDRIEHCSVADPAAVAELADLGITVVTQPSLIARRGDDYLDRHQPDEHGDLWRYGSLLRSGICTVASSDAPYGDDDPWATIRAAGDRASRDGRLLGADEQVDAMTVLEGLLAPTSDPGGPRRRVAVGEPADLLLLDMSLAAALVDPRADHVAATIIAGRLCYDPGRRCSRSSTSRGIPNGRDRS